MLLHGGNPNGRPNSDVLVPYMNGRDLTTRSRDVWIIDFGTRTREEAALYELPFGHVEKHVKPMRAGANQASARENWWLHWNPRPEMFRALGDLARFIATPRVAKHRIFAWVDRPVSPDCQLVVFASERPDLLGILHSRVHEVWARAQGTQLRERQSGFRYTPTTCFETFHFPWPPGEEPADDPRVEAIAAAARELDALRERWLNPPEWTRTEVLEFPGTVEGPWARYVVEPDERGIGTVRWPRIVPRDDEAASRIKRRTLTKLYNECPTWLRDAHRKLDVAVLPAYGLKTSAPDDDILDCLLQKNSMGPNRL